jgi:hypothetical protein
VFNLGAGGREVKGITLKRRYDALMTAETLLLATNSLLPYSLNTTELGERLEIEDRVRRLTDLLLTGLLRR